MLRNREVFKPKLIHLYALDESHIGNNLWVSTLNGEGMNWKTKLSENPFFSTVLFTQTFWQKRAGI